MFKCFPILLTAILLAYSSVQAAPTAVLLDPSGEVGRQYDAKTTPYLFIVAPAGKPVTNPSTRPYGCSVKY